MPVPSDADPITADPRFQKVRARDRGADGAFVYAVRTTGVFCRPSCAARPAKPENMAFYGTPAAARAAGFRPCKRCRPETAAATDVRSARMGALATFIADHADEPLTLDRLAEAADMSPTHLQRTFTSVLGVSPRQFHAAKRLETFKRGLRAGEGVLGAVFDAGYGSTSRAYAAADGGLGMTPTAYRAGGAGETIVYAVRETALGPLMMAAAARGVCFVQFGAGAEALRDQLAAEFPKADLRPAAEAAHTALDGWMEALDAHLSRGGPRPDLPLEVRGTAFQIRVWRFLLGLGRGEAVTYGEVARGVGAPRAVRAAASACAANTIGVLIPCHRVLRSDGGLGGYRWGLERKQVLLDMDRRAAAGGAGR